MSTRIESNSYLTEEQHLVYTLREALERNGGTPSGFLEVLATVVTEGTWRRVPSGVNKDEPFGTFADFIEAKPPFGLGSSVEDVRILLQLKHPHEGVPHIRQQMDAMRAEVASLLGLEESFGSVLQDAREFGEYSKAGGWVFALKVARCVQPGTPSSGNSSNPNSPPKELRKVSAAEFSRLANCSVKRVMRYFRAWEQAVKDGIVPSCEQLRPGVSIDLPEAEVWHLYYGARSSALSDRGSQISATAEAEGISATQALMIAENPSALRVAILGDSRTADIARRALLECVDHDQDLQVALAQSIAEAPALKKAITRESRVSDHLQYVRQIADTGKAKTPGGQTIEVPQEIVAEARNQLARVEEDAPANNSESVSVAYDSLHQLVEQSVEDDPLIREQEKRALFQTRVQKASKALEALTVDAPGDVYGPEIVETLIELQRTLGSWIESLQGSDSVTDDETID